MTPQEIVRSYFERHYHVVMWPDKGHQKGPTEDGWVSQPFTPEDYNEKKRVGIITGQEISPGRFLHDLDIDWEPGYKIAQHFIPKTEFIYGRASKYISHCFYTLPEALPRTPYIDPVDKTMLLEIRGTKENGELGWQSMVPPSIWANREGKRELLEFRRWGNPTHIENVQYFKQRVNLTATAMLLAKRFGHNGFGHEVRLAWAGYLLRAGIEVDDLVLMGELIGVYCNNREVADVRRVVESTALALKTEGKKVKGGPALAKLIGGDAGRKTIAEINRWLGRESDYVRDPDGRILKDHQENIRRAIQQIGYELSYQEFSAKMMATDDQQIKRTLDDRILNSMWLRIDREIRFRPTFVFFERVVTDIAYENSYHPVRDYLLSLKWDQEPRINYWLTRYAEAEEHSEGRETQTYLEAVSSIPLIAAVRRVMHPGCKYDEMLVLESDQGLGKSSALRALCPDEEWFSDDLPLNVDAKEIIERTLGKWIIEASDLVGGRKADRDHLKAMLSRQVDGPARMAYARVPVERPRHFIIIGTTNASEYLADNTGARRFWPVRVRSFDIEGIIRDRDQLWAEAVAREAAGESIRLPQELWDDAGKHQEDRREVDSWEDLIREQVSLLDPKSSGRLQITADALWVACGVTDVSRRDRVGAKRISETMQRYGFRRTNVRADTGDKVVTGYVKDPAITAKEEVAQDNSAAEKVVDRLKLLE